MSFFYNAVLQNTLAGSVSCTGIGLHSGEPISMRLSPLPENSGIVFKRTDVTGDAAYVPATYNAVSATELGTVVRNASGVSVSTVEHLTAALWGAGIDNCLAEVSGGEVPIMDGSSAPFLFMVDCAGIKTQRAKRRMMEILKEVEVSDGNGATIRISPDAGFSIDMTIDFKDTVIQKQSYNCDFTAADFAKECARARTFGFMEQVEHLRAKGLVRGGSTENAIVIDKDGIVNKDKELRYENEFVRHKILDCVGDLFLSGMSVCGKVEGYKSGHALNNTLLRELFGQKDAYRICAAPAA